MTKLTVEKALEYPETAGERLGDMAYEARSMRATIAEQQARLDSIAAILGGVILGTEFKVIEILARGTPRRECAALVKKYGEEKKRG